jgi:hypothetical protein
MQERKMQNKPNLMNAKFNVSNCLTIDCRVFKLCADMKNKPNFQPATQTHLKYWHFEPSRILGQWLLLTQDCFVAILVFLVIRLK